MKKIMNYNIVKVCAFLLFAVGMALPMSAANTETQPLVYDGSAQNIKKGDTIRLNPDSLYYLTGQKISKWVYAKPHVVQQVGGRRFPNGVLIRGIYSWVYPASITPVHPEAPITVAPVVEPETVAPTTEPSVETVPSEMTQETTTIVVDTENAEPSTEEVADTTSTTLLDEDIRVIDPNAASRENYEIPVPYQMDRFSLGVRGGFASNMAGVSKVPMGYDAFLDLRYAHYWAADKNKTAYGIMTGLNVGYLHTFQSTSFHDEFTVGTVNGDVDYVISADKVTQKTNQIQIEVPVMFSMVTYKGFFLNVGPKFILPVYSKYNQQLENPNIYAYKDELNGKPIINEVVMGKVTEEQANYTGNLVDNACNLFSVAMGAELGYEIRSKKNSNSVTLGVYADYSVLSMYKGLDNPAGKIITLTPPTNTSAAIVDVQPISGAFSSKYGFLDAGLKVSYNFNFIK